MAVLFLSLALHLNLWTTSMAQEEEGETFVLPYTAAGTGTGMNSSSSQNTLTLGYITTVGGNLAISSEGSSISGAMTLAVETINQDPTVLPNHTLTFLYADNKGRELRSIRVLTELWRRDAVAFIGPEDFCATEARVAASWNLTMVSYKCDDAEVSDKKQYGTFARTQPPSTQSANSMLALMRHYGWSRFTIVAEETALMLKAGQNLRRLAEASNMTVNDFVNVSEYSALYDRYKVGHIVHTTYLRTRVYVLYTLSELFIDFVNTLQSMGLTDTGEYVVIGIKDDEAYDYSKAMDYIFQVADYEESRTNRSVAAFRSALLLMSMPMTNPNYSVWEEAVRDRLYRPPFSIPRSDLEILLGFKVIISIFASYLYDAVMIYARALHEVLEANGDPRNGVAIFNRIKDRTFKSIRGHDAYIDSNGDAEANYTVLALQPDDNPYGFGVKPVGRFLRDSSDRQRLTFVEDIAVYGNKIPLDEPECGYDGERCRPVPDFIPHMVGGSLAGLVFIGVCVLVGFYRHWRYEQELASLIWKIDPKEIQLQPDGAFSALSIISNNVPYSNASVSLGPDQDQRFTRIGLYRGTLVALKPVHTRHAIDVTRTIKLELKHIRDLRHNNIVQFIGATVESHVSHIVSEYCSKGSLEDILENGDVKLDHMFIASIVSDIMKGLIYIHSSLVVFHGDLKSSNCLVDSRWVVKLSDFGLTEFKSKQLVPYHGEHAAYKRLLWTAPELLRKTPKISAKGTQKGDVYSFGILLYEIICRNGPYGDCHYTPKEIVDKVAQGAVDGIPFRPNTGQLPCEGYITHVIRDCWDEDPELRPDMKTCRKRLRPMQAGMRSNIFDNMMNLMERYANNLETVVAERTVELHEEKKKTETLLHRMLPPSVASQLVRGDPVVPEAYDCVTIYFSDICGFTAMSSESTPLQIVDMLNDLYTLFDRVIKGYDVYKIETIGDAYMVVSGLPRRNGANHAGEIASMALTLLTSIRQFKIRHRPDDVLKLRIGIHSGPCVAGVVGLTMPRYTLFGDTVNTASRMESNGEPLKIHVSGQCKSLLDSLGGYSLVERGLVSMKGKGEQLTYWLLSEDARIRELRTTTRTSDDSGVQTETPSETATTTTTTTAARARARKSGGDGGVFLQNASMIPCVRSSIIFEQRHHQHHRHHHRHDHDQDMSVTTSASAAASVAATDNSRSNSSHDRDRTASRAGKKKKTKKTRKTRRERSKSREEEEGEKAEEEEEEDVEASPPSRKRNQDEQKEKGESEGRTEMEVLDPLGCEHGGSSIGTSGRLMTVHSRHLQQSPHHHLPKTTEDLFHVGEGGGGGGPNPILKKGYCSREAFPQSTNHAVPAAVAAAAEDYDDDYDDDDDIVFLQNSSISRGHHHHHQHHKHRHNHHNHHHHHERAEGQERNTQAATPKERSVDNHSTASLFLGENGDVVSSSSATTSFSSPQARKSLLMPRGVFFHKNRVHPLVSLQLSERSQHASAGPGSRSGSPQGSLVDLTEVEEGRNSSFALARLPPPPPSPHSQGRSGGQTVTFSDGAVL
ncbi:guanylate cyclase 32E-like [Babylonia areolata]|uniref:guanylate cyclase 32E-like n=1 Tax=Babylonia areolata TaxID=304850 RepID=UPI003FD51A3E